MKAKIYYLGQQQLTDFMVSRYGLGSAVSLPVSDGLPLGGTVHTVFYSYAHRAFGVIVEHPDFDNVPEWQEIPAANENLSVKMRRFKLVGSNILCDLSDCSKIDLLLLKDQIDLALMQHQVGAKPNARKTT